MSKWIAYLGNADPKTINDLDPYKDAEEICRLLCGNKPRLVCYGNYPECREEYRRFSYCKENS